MEVVEFVVLDVRYIKDGISRDHKKLYKKDYVIKLIVFI